MRITLIDLSKDLRRQRVAFAVVDSNHGDLVLQVVLDGFDRHKSRTHKSVMHRYTA